MPFEPGRPVVAGIFIPGASAQPDNTAQQSTPTQARTVPRAGDGAFADVRWRRPPKDRNRDNFKMEPIRTCEAGGRSVCGTQYAF
ncbi:hypothetical protein EMIT0158MI4_100046 [Burkholderia ambifaria]